MPAIDVTDETFETEVLARSATVPVVVDLWAPWCGPCRTLGPILESVIDETGGKVVMAKVNVDENPRVSQSFQVQSIPAVFAIRDQKVVNGFLGAQPEHAVREFVESLLPNAADEHVDALIDAGIENGDEVALRQALELAPDNERAIVALAELLIGQDQGEEALALLARIPESPETRRVAALARLGDEAELASTPDDGIAEKLDELLTRVKGDDDARQEFLDLLEVMGPDDPRTAAYRKKLTTVLF